MKTLFIERTGRGRQEFNSRYTNTGVVGAEVFYTELALPVMSSTPDLVVIEGSRGSAWAELASHLVQDSFPGVTIAFLAGETEYQPFEEARGVLHEMIAIYEKTPNGRRLLNCKVTTGEGGATREDSNDSPFGILYEYHPLSQSQCKVA